MGRLENLARERIVRWRKQNGVSQDRLGQVTGTHQTTVGKWEKGDASMDVDTLTAWAAFFGRTLFDLIAHDDLTEMSTPDFVAAYNALPNDDARAAVVKLMQTFPSVRLPAGTRGRKRGKP